jgi:hypothetical protein
MLTEPNRMRSTAIPRGERGDTIAESGGETLALRIWERDHKMGDVGKAVGNEQFGRSET